MFWTATIYTCNSVHLAVAVGHINIYISYRRLVTGVLDLKNSVSFLNTYV